MDSQSQPHLQFHPSTIERPIPSAHLIFFRRHAAPYPPDHLLNFRLALPDSGQEIDEEGEDPARENQSDDPLKHRCDIIMVGESCDRETNRQENLHQNEGQFQPEADPQDAVFPEMDTQLLIFGTGEDRRQDDASDE